MPSFKLAAIFTAAFLGQASLALAEPAREGVEVTWEVMAPRSKIVTMEYEDYITRKTRHTRTQQSLSLEQVDGRDVLIFDYAIGGRCALVLYPQPTDNMDLSVPRRFELRDGFVLSSRREDKIGGRCAAMSHHKSDWDGTLNMVLDQNNNIVMDVQIRSYGRDGRHTATLDGRRIIAKRLVIDHVANARREQESREALASIIFGAAMYSLTKPRSVSPSSNGTNCRQEVRYRGDGSGGWQATHTEEVCD